MGELADETEEGVNGGFHEMEELADETEEGVNGGFHEMEELADETDEEFNSGFHEMEELADETDEEFNSGFHEMEELADETDEEFNSGFHEMEELADKSDEESEKNTDSQEFEPNKESQNEEKIEKEEEYENIGTQSTVLMHENSEIEGENQEELQAESEEYTEEEEEYLENEEGAIEIDPEEYENDQDPIIDTEEIEFVRDMEELGRMLKEYDEKLGYYVEENDNTAFNAEQAYREIKERNSNKEEKEESQKLEEQEKEITEEQKEEHIEEILSGDAQEEDINDTSEEPEIEPEEFDYLWEKYEQYEQEGKSSEEINNLMQEAEETYKMLKSVEKLYEQQEKLKLIDREHEEDDDDVREEIDRVDAIEYFLNTEEKLHQQGKSQEEIDEQVEEIAKDFFLNEIKEKQQNEQEKDVSEELRIEQAGTDEINSDLKEQEQIKQISVYDNDENRKTHEEVERKEVEEEIKTELDDIEVDEVQSYQEKNKESMEKEKKLESEEVKEDEYEKLQQLYRKETGKRPRYAGTETKGFIQWLEKQELKTKELEEKEQKKEKWQKKLKNWIEGSIEEELSSELKVVLKEILQNFQEYEKLEELYKRYEKGELTEKNKEVLNFIINKLLNISPIHLHLYLNISGFKAYYQEHHWWNPALINEIKYKFLRHLSKKYEVLKLYSKNISKFKQLHAKHIRKLVDKPHSIKEKIKLTQNNLKDLLKENLENINELNSNDNIKGTRGKNYSKYYDHFVNLFAHLAIAKLLTKELKNRSIIYYSEPYIYKPNLNIHPDGLIKKNIKSKHIFDNLFKFLNLSENKKQNIKYITIDITSNLSKDNLINKINKYNPNSHTFFLIVGTHWKNKVQTRSLPEDDLLLQKNCENIRIISHKLFRQIIQISSYIKYWDFIIDLIGRRDLEEIKRLSESHDLEVYLYNLDDLEKEFGTRNLYKIFRNELDKKIDTSEKIPEIKLEYIFSKQSLNDNQIKQFHKLFDSDIRFFKSKNPTQKVLIYNKINTLFEKYFKETYGIPDNFNYQEATKKSISYYISLVEQYSTKLKVNLEIKNLAKKIIKRIYNRKIIKKNRITKGYITVALFLAAKAYNNKTTQEKILKQIYLHNSTLRNRLRDFEIVRNYLLRIQIQNLINIYYQKLGISKVCKSLSKNLIRVALRKGVIEIEDNIEHLTASIIYLVSNALNEPVTLKTISNTLNLDRYSLSQVKKKFQYYDFFLKKIQLNAFLDKFGDRLKVSNEVKNFTKKLIEKALVKKIINKSDYSKHIVAAAYYIAFDTLIGNVTIQDIAKKVNIKWDYIADKLDLYEKDKNDNTILKIHNLVNEYGKKLGISTGCIKYTEELINKAVKQCYIQLGFDIKFYIAVAYFFTTKAFNENKALRIISKKLNFTYRTLHLKKKVFLSFEDEFLSFKINSLVKIMANDLKISNDCIEFTKTLIMKAKEQKKITFRDNIKHIIATAFYLASLALYKPITKTEIINKFSMDIKILNSTHNFDFLEKMLIRRQIKTISRKFAEKFNASKQYFLLVRFFIRKAVRAGLINDKKTLHFDIASMYYLISKLFNKHLTFRDIANKLGINEKTIRNKRKAFQIFDKELKDIGLIIHVVEFGKKLGVSQKCVKYVIQIIKEARMRDRITNNIYIPHVVGAAFYLSSKIIDEPLTLRFIRNKVKVDPSFIKEKAKIFEINKRNSLIYKI